MCVFGEKLTQTLLAAGNEILYAGHRERQRERELWTQRERERQRWKCRAIDRGVKGAFLFIPDQRQRVFLALHLFA